MAAIKHRRWSPVVSWTLFTACVACQISYVHLGIDHRSAMTIAIVVIGWCAVVIDALARHTTAVVVAATVCGFGAEIIGLHTGALFGSYHYTDTLGPTVASVPIVVGLAWAWGCYPIWIVCQFVSRMGWLAFIVGVVGWDLFLDPRMVAEGHWSFTPGQFLVPGLGIPVHNFVGWSVVAAAVWWVASLLSPAHLTWDLLEMRRSIGVVMFGWTWIGSIVAQGFFFPKLLGRDLTVSALYGGAAMTIPVLAVVLSNWRNPENGPGRRRWGAFGRKAINHVRHKRRGYRHAAMESHFRLIDIKDWNDNSGATNDCGVTSSLAYSAPPDTIHGRLRHIIGDLARGVQRKIRPGW